MLKIFQIKVAALNEIRMLHHTQIFCMTAVFKK